MRNILALVFLLALVAAPVLADDWSQSFVVTGTPDVRIHTDDGAIKLLSGATGKVEASVHATGYTRGKDYDVQVSQSGNRVDVTVHRRHETFGIFNWGGAGRSIEVRVVVPHSTNVQLNSGDGRVTLNDVAGTIRVTTGDGAIEAARLSGSVELQTGDGKVTAGEIEGSLQAHTGDGILNVQGRFQALNVETGDGLVDVRVENGSTMQRSWSIRSGDGKVTLTLPASFAADLDAATQGGRIDSDFSGNSAQERSRFKARLNNGSDLLTVRTGDGNITIRRVK
jgi:hypothetical protein